MSSIETSSETPEEKPRKSRAGMFAISRAALAAARAMRDTGMTFEVALKTFGASAGSIYSAKRVLRSGNRKLIAQVERGSMSVYAAAELAKGNEAPPHRYIRFDEAQFRHLHCESARTGTSMRQLVRAAVQKYLDSVDTGEPSPSDP